MPLLGLFFHFLLLNPQTLQAWLKCCLLQGKDILTPDMLSYILPQSPDSQNHKGLRN